MVITTTATEPSRRIFVDVESFEIGADGRCLIAARWRITTRDRQVALASEHGTFSETAASLNDADAAAMTRLIDQLAGQIASSTARFCACARVTFQLSRYLRRKRGEAQQRIVSPSVV
jgi:uncharacterized lipoprotein YmbA